ncbi:hypothetical protein [Celerinatantimonas yamalensis]|uniref:Porin n=1 Tax=Celerinatantimonas yamalensis TaxID=559956 RepID=A0ABW9G7H9_9GAMM
MKMIKRIQLVALGCVCVSLASGSVWAAQSKQVVGTQTLKEELAKLDNMQQAYQSELAKMRQLREQYAAQLKKMNEAKPAQSTLSDSKYNKLKEQLDRIQISGFVRAKYDSDDRDGIGSGSNNKHFYMNLEGKMKVSDDWDAHFQSETRKGYTVNQSWRNGDPGSDDQNGTFQRIWVEGKPANIGIALGTKWWGLGFQNVPFGHAADGISVDYDVVPSWNVKAYWLRPRQGDLVTMPNGQETTITGMNITGNITKNLAASITYAGNKDYNGDQKMSQMGAFELQYQATDDILLRGAFVRTNADDYNTSQEYRVDYKGSKLEQVGSYGMYVRYIDFERYGDYSHDDEWGSLPNDAKGWLLGGTFVPFKNVVWETFFSVQRRNRASSVDHNAMRHLLRTQIDFHF